MSGGGVGKAQGGRVLTNRALPHFETANIIHNRGSTRPPLFAPKIRPHDCLYHQQRERVSVEASRGQSEREAALGRPAVVKDVGHA